MVATILGMGAGAMIITIIIWLLPMFLIVKSSKTSGAEKLVWLLAVLFISWFAWILYMLLAPVGVKN